MFRPLTAAGAASVMRFLRITLVLVALASIAALASPAFAQAAAPAASMPWLASVGIEAAFYILGPLFVGAVLAVLARLYSLLGLKQTEAHRATVEQVLERSLDLARARYGRGLGLSIPVEMQQSAMRLAAENAINKGPQAFKRFGITRVDDDRLGDMIESRFADFVDGDAVVSGVIKRATGQ